MSITFPTAEQMKELETKRPHFRWLGYPLFCDVSSETGRYYIKSAADDRFDDVVPAIDKSEAPLARIDVVKSDGLGPFFIVYFVPDSWSENDIVLFVVGHVFQYDDFYLPAQIRKWNSATKTAQWIPATPDETKKMIDEIFANADSNESKIRLQKLVDQKVESKFVGVCNYLYPAKKPSDGVSVVPNWGQELE